MASINDYGKSDIESLAQPKLGGTDGWAAAVAAALDGDDTPVGDRFATKEYVDGTWTPWTPTIYGVTVQSYEARYMQIGKTVRYRCRVVVQSVDGDTRIMLPVAVSTVVANAHAFDMSAYFFIGSERYAAVSFGAHQSHYVRGMTANGAGSPLTASIPAAWAPGDSIYLAGSYEAA